MIDYKRFFKSIGLLNSADQTKALDQTVSNSATTGTKLTLTAKQDKDTNLDYPNIPTGETTDELVSTKSEQTLTNKTLDEAIITNSDITDSTFDGGTITDSTIDNSPIGGTTPSTAEFTTVEATAMTVNGDTVTTNTATQTLSNKSLVDNSTFVIDNSDATKRIGFDSAGSTGTTTTIKSNQSVDITLDLPDTTDVLVARNTTDILTNKTLTSPTINTPTISNGSMSGTTITSGSINDTPIGNTTPSTGVFTDLTSTGTFSSTGNLTLNGDLVVQGDLTVNGTETILNTQTLDVEDTNITVNVGGNDASSEGAGLTIDRTGVEGSIIYKNASATKFAAGDLGSEIDLVGTTSTQTLTNKNLSDTSVAFVDVADATKQIIIDAAGATGTSTTILSSQTSNRTITLPDATDTLVGKSTTDLLSNKQLVDTTTAIVDNVDNTRQIKFDAGGTTGTSVTLTGAQTANRVLTLPDVTDTLVSKTTTDILTNKTLQYLQQAVATDAATTGTTATLSAFTTGIVRATNASLTSLAGIPAGGPGQSLILENKTGNTLNILNEDTGATAANRIQTGTAATASIGANASIFLVYDSTSARWQLVGGTGSGSGSGGVNFIPAGDAESTDPFIDYVYTAGTRPVVSTGGPGNAFINTSITATAPLAGNNSFLITKTNGINQQGLSEDIPFTVSPAYRAKICTIEFDYMLVSGTFQAGSSTQDSDLIVYIIDVDNNISIEPSNFKFLSNSTTISSKFSAQFQTSSNSSNYRVTFYTATGNTTVYSMKIDNIKVSPSEYVYGTPVTDWQAYTPTLTGVPGGASEGFFWKRVGDSIQIKGTFTTGTPDGNPFSFTMPTGLSADSTKQGTNPTSNAVGHIYSLRGTANESFATTTGGPFVAFTDTATNANLIYAAQDTTSSLFTKDAGNEIFINTTKGVVEGVMVPIAGWSSSVQTSDNASTRIVDFTGYLAANTALTANVTNIPYTTEKDTHNAFSAGVYTIPVAGDYDISTVGVTTAGTASIVIHLNNAGTAEKYLTQFTTTVTSGSTTLTNLKAGDTIALRSQQTLTVAGGAKPYIGTLNIKRISGPSTIAAAESINARYFASATAVTGALATVVWTTKDYDSHGGMLSGLYTVSSPGKYQVNTAVALGGTFVLNSITILEIQKNSTAVTNATKYSGGAVTNETIQVSDLINCVAGDVIRIQVSSTGTAPSIISSNTKNFISITKAGL